VLAEVGRPFILSLGVAGYRSVSRHSGGCHVWVIEKRDAHPPCLCEGSRTAALRSHSCCA
jgi:hypothetical protein